MGFGPPGNPPTRLFFFFSSSSCGCFYMFPMLILFLCKYLSVCLYFTAYTEWWRMDAFIITFSSAGEVYGCVCTGRYLAVQNTSSRSSSSSDRWRTLQIVPNDTLCVTVHQLQPSTAYQFMIMSRNRHGDAIYSKPVATSTKGSRLLKILVVVVCDLGITVVTVNLSDSECSSK